MSFVKFYTKKLARNLLTSVHGDSSNASGSYEPHSAILEHRCGSRNFGNLTKIDVKLDHKGVFLAFLGKISQRVRGQILQQAVKNVFHNILGGIRRSRMQCGQPQERSPTSAVVQYVLYDPILSLTIECIRQD